MGLPATCLERKTANKFFKDYSSIRLILCSRSAKKLRGSK